LPTGERAVKTYDYFKNILGRNSWNNSGGIEEVWNRALNDKDKIVNHHAKLFLEEKFSF
jgi:hypothetical protein